MEHECDNYTNCGCRFLTVSKGILKGMEDLEVGGGVGTIQTIAFLRMPRILRRVLESCGDLLTFKL